MYYFREENEKEYLLSELSKMSEEEVESTICRGETRINRTKYLISILGDVLMNKKLYILYVNKFQSFGGRYSVLTRTDTLKDMYDITRKYPYLTEFSIDKLWYLYIRDFFEEYKLMNVLECFIENFGKTDECFEMFIEYVKNKSDEQEKVYIENSLLADELSGEYSEDFIDHIKDLIIRQHYKYEDMKKYFPSSELIKKDEEHILKLSNATRIFFGCCDPISYTLFEELIKKGNIDEYDEILNYYINDKGKVEATFTKQEFLESIKQNKTLKK